MERTRSLVLSLRLAAPSSSQPDVEKHFDACGGSIGRSEACDWVLRAEGVSRQHAWVRCLNGLYFVEDRSTNGMLLNDAPLRKGEPAALNDGDRLQIDTLEITVTLRAREDAATRPGPACTTAAGGSAPLPPAAVEHAQPAVAGDTPPWPEPAADPGLIPDAAGSDRFDPLALLGGAGEMAALADADGREHTPSWNHGAAWSDRFQPPRSRLQPLASTVLPENWDLTQTQFDLVREELPDAREAAPAVPAAEPPHADEPPATGAAAAARDGVDVVSRAEPAPSALEALLHIAVDGMMDILRARAELKNAFRLPVTIIQRRENNPLKFAPNAEEAVKRLLAPPNDAFLAGSAALDDAMDDIRHHQMALLSGVREAFESMLANFDPQQFQATDTAASRRLPFAHGSRPWARYCEHFAQLQLDTDESFRRLFGDAFAHAYEAQLARLKTSGPSHTGAEGS